MEGAIISDDLKAKLENEINRQRLSSPDSPHQAAPAKAEEGASYKGS